MSSIGDPAGEPMPGSIRLNTPAGPVVLLPNRAVWLPALHTLVVADVHLGKAQVLRRHGIPVPRGSTSTDLQRLDLLIGYTSCERLLVLGDLVHAPGDAAAPWRGRLAAWRSRHPTVQMTVVPGNHDRGEDLAAIGFEPMRGVLVEGRFEFAHAPSIRAAQERLRLCGHVHPVVVRRDGIGRLRMPVFWQQPHQLVLPAFGALTGGFEIHPGTGDRFYIATDEVVLALN